MMKTYKALVRVSEPAGQFMMSVWAQVAASSPILAKQMLEAQYGRGNVVSVPTVCTSRGMAT
jgi:hypothetical protein